MDPYQQFSQGVRGAFNTSSNLSSFLIFVFASVIVIFLARAFYKYYNSYLKAKLVLNTHPSPSGQQKKIQEFNPVQKKAVYDIIAEFKKKEFIAQAIPVTVLERFSEYLYQQVDRLKISNSLARRMAMQIYPIPANTSIEIEIYQDDKLYVFERKAIFTNNNVIVVNAIEKQEVRIQKGIPVNVFYTANNQCISGESTILNTMPSDRLTLSYPKNLQVSDVRRFSRITLTGVEGHLSSPMSNAVNPQEIKIILKDISLDGARIQANAVLRKNFTYKLSFQDSNQPGYLFKNIECVVSKSLLGDNIFEYGISFIYLDLETRARLVGYLKDLSARIKYRT